MHAIFNISILNICFLFPWQENSAFKYEQERYNFVSITYMKHSTLRQALSKHWINNSCSHSAIYCLIILCVFAISSTRQVILLMANLILLQTTVSNIVLKKGSGINKYRLIESLTFEKIPTSETQIIKLWCEALLQEKQECFPIYFSSNIVQDSSLVHNSDSRDNIVC